jgi:hypothetical protein
MNINQNQEDKKENKQIKAHNRKTKTNKCSKK